MADNSREESGPLRAPTMRRANKGGGAGEASK